MQRKEIKGLLIDNIKKCVPYLIPNGAFFRGAAVLKSQ